MLHLNDGFFILLNFCIIKDFFFVVKWIKKTSKERFVESFKNSKHQVDSFVMNWFCKHIFILAGNNAHTEVSFKRLRIVRTSNVAFKD